MESDIKDANVMSVVEQVNESEEDDGEIIFQLYCQFCGDCFSSFTELEKHIEVEHEESENNEISLTDDSILKSIELENFTKKSSEILPKDSIDSVKKIDVQIAHKCQFCDEIFQNRDDFEKHIEDGHDPFEMRDPAKSTGVIKLGKKYICPYCDKVSARYIVVLRHMLNSHKNEMPDYVSIARYEYNLEICDICQKSFTSKNELAEHKNRHTRNILYGCRYCSVVTASLIDTHKHMKKAHSDKPDASDKNSVIVHKNTSLGEDKDYFLKRNPYRIRKLHTSKITSGTEIEEKMDATLSNVYKCAYCSLTFHYADTLKKHLETVHASVITAEDLKDMSSYLLHKSNDIAEKSVENISGAESGGNIKVCPSKEKIDIKGQRTIYKCPYCSLFTQYASSLKKHLKRVHDNTSEDTEDVSIFLLDPSKISPAVEKSIKKINNKEFDVSKVSSYFQCPICSYKSKSRANMSRHLDSNRHVEEKSKGILSNLDISQLKVKCKKSITHEVVDSTANTEKEDFGEESSVKSDGVWKYYCPYCEKCFEWMKSLKRHFSKYHKDKTLVEENIKKVRIIDEVCSNNSLEGTNNTNDTTLITVLQDHSESLATGTDNLDLEVSNSRNSTEPEEKLNEFPKTSRDFDQFSIPVTQDVAYLQQMYKLPEHQPFVKLERMKLPVKMPNEDFNSKKVIPEHTDTSAKYKASSEPTKANRQLRNSKKQVIEDKVQTRSVQKGKLLKNVESKQRVSKAMFEKKNKQTPPQARANLKIEANLVRRSAEKSEDQLTDTSSQEHKCPYCSFQCKRASALKFHINFNHKNAKSLDSSKTVNLKSKQTTEEQGKNLIKPVVRTPVVRVLPEKRKRNDTDNLSGKTLSSQEKMSIKRKHEIESKERKPEEDKATVKKVKSSKNSAYDANKVRQTSSTNANKARQTSSAVRIVVINRDGLVIDEKEIEETDDEMAADDSSSSNIVVINKDGTVDAKGETHQVARVEEKKLDASVRKEMESDRTKDKIDITVTHDKEIEREKKDSKDDESKDDEQSNSNIKNNNESSLNEKGQEAMEDISEHESIVFGGAESERCDQAGDNTDEQASNMSDDIEEIIYVCPVCNARYKWLETMKKHIVNCHPSVNISDVQIETAVEEREGDWQHVTDKEPKTEIRKQSQHVSDEETEKASKPKLMLYKCPFCDKCVELMKSMKKHIMNHHKDKTFDQKNIVTVRKSEQHSRDALQRFQCPVCPLQLQWKHSILRHIRNFHEGIHITAEAVKPVFSSVDLKRHLCPFCPLQFKWKHSVVRHVGRFHPHRVDDFSVDRIKSKVTDSPTGDVEKDEPVSTVNMPDVHVNIPSLDNEDVAENGSELTIKDEGVQHEDDIETDERKPQKHHCTKCSKSFGSYAALWKHKMICHNVKGKPFKCRTCPKTFVFQYQRNKHEKIHMSKDEKCLYTCDQDGCNNRYTEKKGLYRHLREKHGESDPASRLSIKKEKKVYHCEECSILFRNASSFWRHNLRAHKEDKLKKHECKICMKRFLFPHELKDHMFVHIHRADISCPVAGCHFKTKKLKYLSNHLRFQLGIKVDNKTLGEHVLSQEQMTAEELLNLFSFGNAKVESGISEGAVDPDNPDESETPIEIHVVDAEDGSVLELITSVTDTENRNETNTVTNTENLNETNTDTDTLDSQQEELPEKKYRCKVCSQTFATHRRLIHHKVSSHPEDTTVYKCDQCPKSFFTNYDLSSHKVHTHSTSKDHICDQCGKSFPVLNALKKHMTGHEKNPVIANLVKGQKLEPVICDLCGMSLRSKSSLQIHNRRAHPEKIKCTCKVCSSKFDFEQPGDKNELFCSLCNQYFCKKIFFDSHMRSVHNTTGRHRCNFCPLRFSSLSEKNMHMHQTHTVSNDPAASEEAEVGQISTLNDDTHIIEISNDDQKGPKFLPKLSEQGMKAVTKELKIYTEESTGKHWKCLLCGQCFSKVKYFNLHVRRTHVRPEHQPYRCKVCGAGFVRVGEFRKHTRSHSGFRPLKCKVCHKAFKQQAHLKEHSLIHTDARKFTCEICQGSFKQRGALLAHVIRHDKVKPFKCGFCGLGFTARGSLSKHMKKYYWNNDADYLCHICQKSFSHYPLLLRHIESHQEPHPFICEICNSAFAAYTSLYFHKVREKHFREEDYETPVEKKPSKKGSEDVVAVGTLVEDGRTEQHPQDIELETEVLTTEHETGSAPDQTAVEIVIEDPAAGGHAAAFKVEGHTDDEILSIARQLTEMSSYPGQEVFIEEIEDHARNDEEEKIMINMLDADEEVKSNLERTLMLSKAYNVPQQVVQDTKIPENTYVEILNYVDANGVPVDQEGNHYERHVTFIDGREIEVTECLVENSVEVHQEPFATTDIQTANTDTVTGNELTHGVAQNVTYTELVEEDVQNTHETEVTSAEVEPVLKTEVEVVQEEPTTTEVVLKEPDDTNDKIVLELTEDELAASNKVELDNSQHISPVQAAETTSEDEMNVSYGHTEQGHSIDTSASTKEQEIVQEVQDTEAKPLIADTDVFEPSVLQYESQQYSTEEAKVIEQNAGEKAETVDPHGLVTVSVPEYNPENADASAPMYVFRKSDGSLVYICVAQEHEVGSNEVLNTALGSEVYLEEPDMRDDSTLEAAEILKSVADSTKTIAEVEPRVDKSPEETQDLQIHMYGSIPPPDLGIDQTLQGAVYASSDGFDLSSMKRIIKTENAAEQTVAYVCSICHSVLKTKKNLREHLRRHNSTEDRPFGCTACSKRFVTKTELTRHSRVHTDYRPCVCNVCGKKFRQPGHLLTHKLTHTGEKPYGCNMCKARFTTSSLLKNHSVTHSDERAWKCSFCSMTFKMRTNLRRHQAIHSGIVGKNKLKLQSDVPQEEHSDVSKKHVCHLCGKGYPRKSKLEEHIAVHENLRSFMCDVCGDGFNTKTALDVHAFKHKDERPEVCETCGKAFKRAQSLRNHKKIHAEGEDGIQRRFVCPSCNRSFTRRGALYYHIGVSPDCVAKGKAQTETENEEIKETQGEEIGENQDEEVRENQDVEIRENLDEEVSENQDEEVSENQDEEIKETQDEKTVENLEDESRENQDNEVKENQDEEVSG